MNLSWEQPQVRIAVIVALVAAAAGFAVYNSRGRAARPNRPASAPVGDAVIIAATGDAAIFQPLRPDEPQLAPIVTFVRRSSFAVTNFEATVLATVPADPDEEPRWPAAVVAAPDILRALGFSAVSLANNHVTDYGLDGLRETEDRIGRAGLVHAGTGENLEQARAPAFVDTPGGRVALIAIAASHAPISRAAPSRGEIRGRPGLSPLRYARRVTVDGATFASLKKMLAANAGPSTALPDGTLNLFGTTVRRGDRNHVELVADQEDIDSLVTQVTHARRSASVVVVSIHAHEPGNLSDDVPEFLRGVAHRTVDAGADMVVGHGPHRLRGIELYAGRPILYSLGNFIFPDRSLIPAAADVFEDTSQNLLAGVGSSDTGRATIDLSEDVYWQSTMALARFERGRFVELELQPIDLGVGENRATRGVPRIPTPHMAAAILSRLQVLSRQVGTVIEIRGGVGLVRPQQGLTGGPPSIPAGPWAHDLSDRVPTSRTTALRPVATDQPGGSARRE